MNYQPRSKSRPPLNLFATVMQFFMWASLLLAVVGMGFFVSGDEASFGVSIAGFGGFISCGMGWTLVYIARTLDEIGFAVGAPANSEPLPPSRAQVPPPA